MWSSESFYSKSKLYIQKADSLPSDDRFYIFWHLLALELLIKSSIAFKARPLLAAEGKNGQNLLYSLGIEITPTPTQRNISELIDFLTHLVPDFKKEDKDEVLVWMKHRNEELHSGSDKLSEIVNTGWISDYYRITKKLITYLEKDIADFYGRTRAQSIEAAISTQGNGINKLVMNAIADSKTYFSKMLPVEKEKVRSGFKRPHGTKVTECPSCKEQYLVVHGDLTNTSSPSMEDGYLHVISKYIPTRAICEMCRLQLIGYSQINAAGLGVEFSLKEYIDPVEIFNIDIEEEFNSRYPGRDAESYRDEYQDE